MPATRKELIPALCQANGSLSFVIPAGAPFSFVIPTKAPLACHADRGEAEWRTCFSAISGEDSLSAFADIRCDSAKIARRVTDTGQRERYASSVPKRHKLLSHPWEGCVPHLRLMSVAALFLTAPAAFCADKYDFGSAFTHKSVTLERRLAPEAQLQNTSIDVRFPQGATGLDTTKLKAQLTTDIIQNAPTIRLVETTPDYEIRITVLNYERPHFENRKQGTTTTKTPVGSATVSFTLVHRTDQLAVVSGTESYRAMESLYQTASPVGGLLGSMKDSVKNSVDILHHNGSSTPDSDEGLQLRMIQVLALRIASHMVVTSETISVPLARGPVLETADKLAAGKRWEEMAEQLSKQAALPSPGDDAYRRYDIGVADEALGYASSDPQTTMRFLQEASKNYTQAIQDKPDEKYFIECQSRIESALNRYDQLAARAKQVESIRIADERTAKQSAERHKAGGINNADIITLVEHHVDPAIILTRIRTAPTVDFDLGVDGLIALSNAHVPSTIVNEMSVRATTPAPAAAPAAAAPAAQTPAASGASGKTGSSTTSRTRRQ